MSRSTINHHDPDVTQVAAALGDAMMAGGLSAAYYKKADDALKSLANKLDTARRDERIGVMRELAAEYEERALPGNNAVGLYLSSELKRRADELEKQR